MRLLISIIAIAALAVLTLSACNSAERSNANPPVVTKTNPVATAPGDGVRRVTTVELKTLLEEGQAVVIDVRNQSQFEQGHIRGSKLIPSNEILNHISELPRDKMIVTYCS